MRICRLSLFVVILAIMGLLITPTIIFAEEEYNDGDDMIDPSDGGDNGNSGGNYDVKITEMYPMDGYGRVTHVFPVGSYAFIHYVVENQGTDTAYNVTFEWSSQCLLDNITNNSINRLPLPGTTGSTQPNGGILYRGQQVSGDQPIHCVYLGSWIITLTVKVGGTPVDSRPVTIVIVPTVEE